jgi:hypothetical protein
MGSWRVIIREKRRKGTYQLGIGMLNGRRMLRCGKVVG